MTVLLDDQTLPLDDLAPGASVADVLARAKERLTGTGAIIVGLRRDQQDIPGDELEEMLSQPFSRSDDLEFISDRPQSVVLEALAQVRLAFLDTFAEIKIAADALASGKVSEAMQTLARSVEVWGRTHTSIIQGGLLVGLNFDAVRIGDHPIAYWLNQLATKLRDLKAAIESRDLVLLGDILRYELDDTLQQWEQMLNGFIAHIERL